MAGYSLGPGDPQEAAAVLDIPGAARILDGMAAGETDEVIARGLGVSTRTLNRRIALLMETLGARTRFQLGARLTPELCAHLRPSRETAEERLDSKRPSAARGAR